MTIFGVKVIPNRYRTEPLDWLSNQFAHTMAGQAAAMASCMAWFYVAGEFPYKVPLFIVLALIYYVWVELIGQGWQGVDTLEDTGFFCVGAGFILYAFTEIHLGTGQFFGTIQDITPLFLGWLTYLVGGATGRAWNRARENGSTG